jgi:hypothetical protein
MRRPTTGRRWTVLGMAFGAAGLIMLVLLLLASDGLIEAWIVEQP